jgi:hypothetical protein
MPHRTSALGAALTATIVLAVGLQPLALGSAPVARAAVKHCPAFVINANTQRYSIYDIRAWRTRCATVRRVLRDLFAGKGHEVSPGAAADGFRVDGWTAGAVDLETWGLHGSSRFDTKYR